MKHTRFLLAPLIVFLFVIQYQNCSWTKNSESSSANATKMDGGNGYDGKVSQYVRWDDTGLCPDRILESIVLENAGTPNQQAFLTRRKCEDITPEPLTLGPMDFVSHNTDNLVHGLSAFDLIGGEATSESMTTSILCRGEVDKKQRGVRVLADVRITTKTLSDGTLDYVGKTFLGVYDLTSGMLLQDQKGDKVSLTKNTPEACGKNGCASDFDYFLHSEPGEKLWRLKVPIQAGEKGSIRIYVNDADNISAQIPCFRK